MPIDPLTAQLLVGGGGGNEAAMLGALDPNLAAATPELQLGQQMIQQGISTAPTVPGAALARALQGAIGAGLQKGAISDLGKAYSGSVDAYQNLFPPGTAIGNALRSGQPLVVMQGINAANKAMILNYQQSAPQTEPAKAAQDARLAAAAGNPAEVRAIEQGASKDTYTDTGVPRPATPLLPPRIAPPTAPQAPPPVVSPRVAPTGPGATPTVAVPPPQAQSAQPTPEQMATAKTKLAQNLTGQTNPTATGIGSFADTIAAAKGAQAQAEEAGKAKVEYGDLLNPPPQGKGPGLTEPVSMPSPSGGNIKVPPVNAQAQLPGSPAEAKTALPKWDDTKTTWNAGLAPGQLAVQRLTAIKDAMQSFQSGTFTTQRAEIAAALKSAGLPGVAQVVMTGDPSQVQLALHENIGATLTQLKAATPRFAQMEFRILSENKEHPNLLPEANFQMLAEDLGQIHQAMDVPNTWAAATKNGWKDPQSYEAEFLKLNPLSDYVAREKQQMGPLKGMTGAVQTLGQTGVPAATAPQSRFTPAQIQAEMKRRGLM